MNAIFIVLPILTIVSQFAYVGITKIQKQP